MELPDIGRYRRRFIVEFGPEDSGLIDRMGVAHRTKRGAIIAGLRLLESGEVEQLRGQVVDLKQELAQAKESLASATRTAATSKPELAKAEADLKAEREAHQATMRTLTNTKAKLTKAQADIVALQREHDRLTDLVTHYAYCGACDKLVPEAEWAEQPARKGFDVYHKSDG